MLLETSHIQTTGFSILKRHLWHSLISSTNILWLSQSGVFKWQHRKTSLNLTFKEKNAKAVPCKLWKIRNEWPGGVSLQGSPCNPPKALRIWPLSKGVKFILFVSRLSLNNLLSLPSVSQVLQWNLQTLVVPSVTMERTYTSYWNDYGTFRQLGSFTKMLSLFWLCIYSVAGLL